MKSYFNPPPEPPSAPQIERLELDANLFGNGNAGLRAGLDSDDTNDQGLPDDTVGVNNGALPNIAGNTNIGPNAVMTTDHGDDPTDTSDTVHSWTLDSMAVLVADSPPRAMENTLRIW